MLLKIVYLLTCRVLGLTVVVFSGDRAKVLNCSCSGTRTRCRAATPASQVRYEPADPVWLSALARLLPRRRWTGIFPVTPATLLALGAKEDGLTKIDAVRPNGSGTIAVNRLVRSTRVPAAVAHVLPHNEITLPMPGHLAIGDLAGTVLDRTHPHNPGGGRPCRPARLSLLTAGTQLDAQAGQLALRQRAHPGVNRLVRHHLPSLPAGLVVLQPARHL